MKKILLISYTFPPLFCGIGRQVSLTKYLPDYGWQPIVLSVKKSKFWPRYDDSYLKDIPKNIKIFRTISWESKFLCRYFQKSILLPDIFAGWCPFAVMEGLRIIRNEKINIIFSTAKPHTCHLVGYILKKITGLPWVADFRDLWSENNYDNYSASVLKLKVNEKLEKAVVNTADRITAITEAMSNDLAQKHSAVPREKFIAIMHGFDPADIHLLKHNKISDKFVISYAGSISGFRQTHTFLLAVKELIYDNPDLKEKLRIKFVGPVSFLEKFVKVLSLEGIVEIRGPVSHEEALTFLAASDILLLIVGTSKTDTVGTTGKLFDYIAVGKPILALSPESAASDMIRKADLGIVTHPTDKNGIKDAIMLLYQRFLSKQLGFSSNKGSIDEYNVEKSVEKFAQVFDALTKSREL